MWQAEAEKKQKSQNYSDFVQTDWAHFHDAARQQRDFVLAQMPS
jgi:hypothetical protein